MQGDVNTPYKKLLLMYAVPQLNPLTFMHLMHTFDTNIAWQIQHILPPTPSIKIEPGIPEHNPDKLIGYKNPMTEKRPQATSQKTSSFEDSGLLFWQLKCFCGTSRESSL